MRTIPHPRGALRWSAALALAAALAAPAAAQPDSLVITGGTPAATLRNGVVTVTLQTGEFVDYRNHHAFHAPPGVVFARWTDLRTSAGEAWWELYQVDATEPDGRRTLASAPLQNAPFHPGETVRFQVNLGAVLPAENAGRGARQYRLAVFSRPPVRQTSRGGTGLTVTAASPGTGNARPAASGAMQPVPSTASGYTVLVQQPGPGPDGSTSFTLLGTRPELLHTMPIAIDLQTLTVEGDDDVEPYLLVAAVFVDGTTIVPQVNPAEMQVTFPTSTVRVAGGQGTHGNVTGGPDMDAGETVSIPAATGHFEAVIRPIGLPLATQFDLPEADVRALRENTQVAILVVGMEEDNIPSTATANETRGVVLDELRTVLNGIVRGVVLDVENLTEPPDVVGAAQEAAGGVLARVRAAAAAKTAAEVAQYLMIPTAPVLVLVPGILNSDDYVGTGVFAVSYQQLLDAGLAGVTFTLTLSDGADEPARYEVRGRVRIR